MKRSTAEELHLISFTLKMFFLHFLIRNCIDEFTLKTEGHQNIASNPSYRGISQTGSFAICSDFFFVSQIHISIMESKFFFFKTHHLIPLIYIFFYVVLDQCWDAMYFPLSRSLLVYLSRFLSEHLMKRSHLGQLWGGRQQGATCSNPPCLYFSRSHCQVIVIGLTFQCNRCGNNFAPINNMEKRLCRAGHLNRRSQSTSSSNALVWKIEISMVSAWIKYPQKWQIPTFSNSNVRQFDGTYVALR